MCDLICTDRFYSICKGTSAAKFDYPGFVKVSSQIWIFFLTITIAGLGRLCHPVRNGALSKPFKIMNDNFYCDAFNHLSKNCT